MEVGNSEKEEVGYALRSSRRKANVSFSDRSRPPQEFVDLSNQMYIVERIGPLGAVYLSPNFLGFSKS
ncbi:hypothetical protein [Aneurinibacillus migulanus]|uniref:hypothetical protein n=1 Tax=Aneurinibacillus migulanus TaxID=47500 RepID=UPI000AF1A50B|nr:hypothetical protein [Aneurinibacillus migulanus]MCP1356939.1 hypothetical protein [Aneurinibacillus migulanus]